MPTTIRVTPSVSLNAAAIHQAHQLYCQLTGQTLRLAFDRERMWFELLRVGYTLQDLRSVILYAVEFIMAGEAETPYASDLVSAPVAKTAVASPPKS